jgi:glycosyltransferase involved in cell wall biosynthesis
MLVLFQSGKPDATQIFRKGWWGKITAAIPILAERYLAQWLTKASKTPFSIEFFGFNLHKHPLVKSADIIHIHWVNHGFLNAKSLANLALLDKPVIWTFHDSNAFTGGCHVRYDCENFHRQCGNCPQLKWPGDNDLSHQNWKRKQKAYSKLHFQIIAPSRWMAQSVKDSSLMAIRKINVIPNTLDINTFKPYSKKEAKQILKINPDKFVILSGFMPSKNDKHKGTQYLIEALKELSARVEIDNEQIEMVVFGNKNEDTAALMPFKTTYLGTINKDEYLAKCYSAADVFVAPSLEDNLPNTVMEALACATPVVAFHTGGIPDMVSHLHNGYLADYQSSTDLADGMEWLMFHDSAVDVQKEARHRILQHFSPQVVANKHLDLYEKVLSENLL